ncbi:hypothetical protein E2P60_06215 [Candidatus Bathyarchaeota archaeon]|nr:hypothetical protein E2P60_06215 [Candidatus Bathyarchaeota archaeon]
MQQEKASVRLRIDVDYPYPSRIKSFICTALGIKTSKDYLKNSKILSRMINESKENVKAFWFFTPKTIPDNELLTLLNGSKHEVALHVVNNHERELEQLKKATGRKIRFYTIHGTARLFARIMWKRWKTKSPIIPKDFPLQSFHQFPTHGLDRLCFARSTEQAVKMAESRIKDGIILEIHPIWLFQKGKINRRGPFYDGLRRLLKVDKELETIVIRKRLFFKVANDTQEYARDIIPLKNFIEKLEEKGVDMFTFIERKWCNTISNPSRFWLRTEDNIALLKVTTYNEWWKNVGKKTRNMVRKGQKSGIKTEVVEPNEKLAEGIWKIYNETPIRQGRAFPHYGTSLQQVKKTVSSAKNCTFIGAFLQDELAGFIQLIYGDKIAIISQILTLKKHSDKAVNNSLIAKTVEVCGAKQLEWIMYGRMGNHPSLDKFKQNNDFSRFTVTRYFVPITKKGRIVAKMGLHREAKDMLSQPLKYQLIPLYNWISRNKMRIKLSLNN